MFNVLSNNPKKKKKVMSTRLRFRERFWGFWKKVFFKKIAKNKDKEREGEVLESEVYSSRARMLKASKKNFQKSTMVPCIYLSLFGS
jgi:hypothetical protein